MRRARPIELSVPAIGPREIRAAARVLRSRWLGLGPVTERFEARYARYVGARHCVATSSGTAALHLALTLLDLTPGDEVIVPALTFVATAHAVRYARGRPVFADVAPNTLTLDPADVARKLTRRTRAVIPVHYAGHPAALDELHAVAGDAGIVVIEDAAHAAGARYRGRRIGNLSRLTCFSFHAAKNLTTGEGGAVTCDAELDARTLARRRFLGIADDTWRRRRDGAFWRWRYDVRELGYKYAMNDVAAAIGLVQLAKLERANARRRVLAARYARALGDLSWLELPRVQRWALSAHYTFPVRVRARAALARHLAAAGIATGVHYTPLHHHAAYRDDRADVPVTERVWRRLLLLPLHPTLGRRAQDRVIDAVRGFRPRAA
jgi:perosamine synthetase